MNLVMRRIPERALEYLATLPDQVVDHQDKTVEHFREIGWGEEADILSDLEPDEYVDFVVNFVEVEDPS